MGYRTDGSSHSKGIQIEYDIVDFAQTMYDSGFDIFNVDSLMKAEFGEIGKVKFEHKGGTNDKADAVVICTNSKGQSFEKTISIKKKKYKNNKPSGTFDVINTTLTNFDDKYHVFGEDIIKMLNEWLEAQRPNIKSKNDIENIREGCAKISDLALDKINDNTESFVKLTKDEFLKTDYLVVAKTEEENDKKLSLKGVFVENESNITLFENENDPKNFYYVVKGRGKSSRQIWYRDKFGNNHKTPFRVRLVLNNGLSAYYGFSDSNDSSVWTIKIQVDGVTEIVKQMKYHKIKD